MAHRTPISAILSRFGCASFTLALIACGNPPAVPSAPPSAKLAESFVVAFDGELSDPLNTTRYLETLDRSVANPNDPESLATGIAALDALVWRSVEPMGIPGHQGLAYRSRDAFPQVVDRLRNAFMVAGEKLDGSTDTGNLPILRGLIAMALHELALYVGQDQAAMVWGERRGCAREATIVAPIDWAALRGLSDPSPIAASGPLPASFPGPAPFWASITPQIVPANACQLDPSAPLSLPGVRAFIIDIDNPRQQRLHFALSSSSAAIVEIAGTRLIERGFESGDSYVTRMAKASVPKGRARIIVRVGYMNDGEDIELDVWGEDGLPIPSKAPIAGDSATVTAVSNAERIEITPTRNGEASLSLTVAALLGVGEGRIAEHLLETRALSEPTTPRLALLASRATLQADDLPNTKQIERLRAFTDQSSKGFPDAWEALLMRAALTERRRAGEGLSDALLELGVTPPANKDKSSSAKPISNPMLLAYIAAAARRGRITDVAEDAYQKIEALVPGSALLSRVDTYLHNRVGKEAVAAACEGGGNRSELACMHAHQLRGDARSALEELGRVRRLRNSPDAFRDSEISLHILAGDLDSAITAYDKTPPGHRRLLEALGFAAGKNRPDLVRPRLARDQMVARDVPYAIPILRRILALEPDPAGPLELAGKRLVDEDRATNFMPGAGTAVLRHSEKYLVEPSGVIRVLTYDLRRVSGTTDVAEGAVSYGPSFEANSTTRILRRRIHKKDGRTVEPDRMDAEQSHSDLSELEKGDYVEQILESVAIPDVGGQIVVDSPDLMPLRTGVREAEIELRRPAGLNLSLWSHALLGKPNERTEGSDKIVTWHLENHEPRRIEDGVSRLEQSVGISFGTQSWKAISRLVDDHIRSLEDKDPYITRFAREAAGEIPKTPSRALLDRVVAAVGKRVKVPGGGELSDVAAAYSSGPQRTTARTVLELGQGSRTLVVWRALQELGVDARIAVAELEPFSGAPNFPAHFGRFRYPLVVARLPEGEFWIDADVDGPPLPPGRISPELRGRKALLTDGQMLDVKSDATETGDRLDLRLVLDNSGVARGTLTIELRGREAQTLADALDTQVGSDRREMLRDVVLKWVPWADVEDVSLTSSEGSFEFIVQAKVGGFAFSQPETKDGKTLVVPGFEPVHLARGYASTLAAMYASQAGRESALSIERPIQYRVRRRIELPKSAIVTRPAAPLDLKGNDLHATRVVKYEGGAIEEEFILDLPTGTIAAEEYESFVQRVRSVDDAFLAGTRVRITP
ncbi:MAG TPA: hypothetical protein PK156_05300 [Polyangium sp.]|nr:hypothetical protein [Polyangium sp.]